MWLVVVGCVLSISSLIGRACIGQGRQLNLDAKFYALLGCSLAGGLIAFRGFYEIANSYPIPTLPAPVNTADYSQILTVLSLLAAGIVTGYFTFTFQEAEDDEKWIATAISVCFAVLFYAVFGALSLYIGLSPHVRASEHATILLPAIMWLLLAANALYDFWDYRERPAMTQAMREEAMNPPTISSSVPSDHSATCGLHVDLRAELIKHLSKEIEVLSTNTITTRLRAVFTVWIGPFILLGALVIRRQSNSIATPVRVVFDCALTTALALLGMCYLLIAYAAGRMERYVADKCNEWRELMAVVSLKGTLEDKDILTLLQDYYLPQSIRVAYAVVFAAMFIAIVAIAYIVVHIGAL